jgi:hypothetical protein
VDCWPRCRSSRHVVEPPLLLLLLCPRHLRRRRSVEFLRTGAACDAPSQPAQIAYQTYGPLALDAFGGRLVGSDEGEWGGKLVFTKSESVTRLLNVNVGGIFRIPHGIVVFTGLAHLTLNHGEIYEVKETPKGIMTRRLFRLVGEPKDLVQQPDGAVRFAAFASEWKGNDPVYRCFELTGRARLRGIACANGGS